jgi:KUP system potassium uptake protein
MTPRAARVILSYEHVVILTVTTAQVPHVPRSKRVSVQALGHELFNVHVEYGFKEDPNVPGALILAQEQGLRIDSDDVTFFLGRETVIVTRRQGMAVWGEKLFVLMARNAGRGTPFSDSLRSGSSSSASRSRCD